VLSSLDLEWTSAISVEGAPESVVKAMFKAVTGITHFFIFSWLSGRQTCINEYAVNMQSASV